MSTENSAINVVVSGQLAADLKVKAVVIGMTPEALVEAILRVVNAGIAFQVPVQALKEVSQMVQKEMDNDSKT